jgi:hypothetical protein
MELSAATAPAASSMLMPCGSTWKTQITSEFSGLWFKSTKSKYFKPIAPQNLIIGLGSLKNLVINHSVLQGTTLSEDSCDQFSNRSCG